MIAGIIGNSMFQPAMTDFFDEIEEKAQEERAIIESIEPTLMQINSNRTLLRGYVNRFTTLHFLVRFSCHFPLTKKNTKMLNFSI